MSCVHLGESNVLFSKNILENLVSTLQHSGSRLGMVPHLGMQRQLCPMLRRFSTSPAHRAGLETPWMLDTEVRQGTVGVPPTQ